MSSLVLAVQRLIRVGNKGVSLYFGAAKYPRQPVLLKK